MLPVILLLLGCAVLDARLTVADLDRDEGHPVIDEVQVVVVLIGDADEVDSVVALGYWKVGAYGKR